MCKFHDGRLFRPRVIYRLLQIMTDRSQRRAKEAISSQLYQRKQYVIFKERRHGLCHEGMASS